VESKFSYALELVNLEQQQKDKTMKRIKNNDLTHWFIRDHSELPESYLKHCREFFESLGIKTKANELQADKLQAASSKQRGLTKKEERLGWITRGHEPQAASDKLTQRQVKKNK